jgi:hypothetical protein
MPAVKGFLPGVQQKLLCCKITVTLAAYQISVNRPAAISVTLVQNATQTFSAARAK